MVSTMLGTKRRVISRDQRRQQQHHLQQQHVHHNNNQQHHLEEFFPPPTTYNAFVSTPPQPQSQSQSQSQSLSPSTTMNDLPSEVLWTIFLMVDSESIVVVPSVCRKWRRMCVGIKPDTINLERFADTLCDTAIVGISSRFRGLKSLSVEGCTKVSLVGLKQVLERWGSSLTTLNLNFCKQVTDEWLETVASLSPNLTSLQLHWCYQVSDIGLQKLASRCKSLTSLNVAWCALVTNVGIETLSRGCSQLRVLNLSNCYKLSNYGLHAISRCTQLQSISLRDCKNVSGNDRWIEAMGIGCPNFRHLDFTNCPQICDDWLHRISKTSWHLQSINLTGCAITNQGIAYITKGCGANIESLTLAHCGLVTNGAVLDVAEGCPRLVSLDLTYIPVLNCGVEAVGKKCPLLRSLKLAYSFFISIEAIVHLTFLNPKLETLDLSYCHQVCDAWLAVLSSCPDLTSLNLTNCTRVSNVGLSNIANTCPNLSSLEFYDRFCS